MRQKSVLDFAKEKDEGQRFTVRLPSSLYDRASLYVFEQKKSVDRRASFNKLLAIALEEYLDKETPSETDKPTPGAGAVSSKITSAYKVEPPKSGDVAP